MPIREFLCRDCGHTFEELVRPYEEPNVECAHCETKNCERLISAHGGYIGDLGGASTKPKSAGSFKRGSK